MKVLRVCSVKRKSAGRVGWKASHGAICAFMPFVNAWSTSSATLCCLPSTIAGHKVRAPVRKIPRIMSSLFIQIMIAIILKTNFRPLEIQFQGKRKVYFPKKFMGTSRGARTLCPAIVDGKQQSTKSIRKTDDLPGRRFYNDASFFGKLSRRHET